MAEVKPWPPAHRVVRQEKGSKDCTACVAAMVLGMTLEQVKKHMRATVLPDGSRYYKMRELLRIIGEHGIVAGFYFTPADQVNGDRIADDANLTCNIPIQGRPCILCVKSKTQTEADHMVFYDGKAVLDPQEDEPQPLSSFMILEIYPVTYFIDKGVEGERPDTPIYDKLMNNLADAGIRMDGGNIHIEAPAAPPVETPPPNVFEGETECILRKVKFQYNLGTHELTDDLRIELEDSAAERIRDMVLNGYSSGKLSYCGDPGHPDIEGEWFILKE